MVVFPIAAGLVVAAAFGFLVLTPLSFRLSEQRQQVDQFRRLKEELPSLQVQLSASQRELTQRREQQQSLLSLVAGVSELDTFLAELNDLAIQTDVRLTRKDAGVIQVYEAPVDPVLGEEDAAPPAAGGEGTTPVDPLLREGLERRSAQLGVTAPFRNLVRFMRELERLQVFVEISDLSLKQAESVDAENQPMQDPELALALTLTTYGRAFDR